MKVYCSRKCIVLLSDIVSITISFVLAIRIRYSLLVASLGSELIWVTYLVYFLVALVLYCFVFFLRTRTRLERQSYREIIFSVVEQQFAFIIAFVMLFFLFHRADAISRVVVGLFYFGNVIFCSVGRIGYHIYCTKHMDANRLDYMTNDLGTVPAKSDKCAIHHVYIIGSKSLGQYGGFEYFVMNLLQNHRDNSRIKYHVACKANGDGHMDLSKLDGAVRINENEFSYANAHGFLIHVPEKLRSAGAIYYDLKALQWVCNHIEENHIAKPIVYILACRVGPFEKKYVERIHDAGGLVYQNPDGHEYLRRKWNYFIQRYWKMSEMLAVKYADLVVCDSKGIEQYIKEDYALFKPRTTFIAYGSDILPSNLSDTDSKYVNWLKNHNLVDGQYIISVGRFAPENNFDIMIREFMLSNTDKDFAIVTTDNPKFAQELQQKYQYKKDKRIKFVGTVYDQELLTKIRANACAYIHGHEVGGTNPSLLEALGSTKVNLLYDVQFNREVAEDAAMYWTKEEGSLAGLIDIVDRMNMEDMENCGDRAKNRIRQEYNWKLICDKYEAIFCQGE